MATQVQWRRGTHAQILAFTGATGEVVVDSTQNRMVVQDGSTTGGWPQALLLDLGQDAMNWKTVSGTANAIVLTSQNSPMTASQIVAGTRATFKATGSISTSTPTIVLDAQASPATVRRSNQALAYSDIQTGLTYVVEFDGTYWQLVNGVLSGNANSAFNEAAAASIVSASSVELGTITGNRVDVTGTTTITAFTWGGNAQVGAERWVKFTGVLTLTYNATSLILPTAASIVTAAGDYACFRNLGSGNTECLVYQRASGQALASLTTANTQYFTSSGTWTAPVSFSTAIVICLGSGGGGGAGTTSGGGGGGAGGGGGSRISGYFRSTDLGASQTVTIGAGGAGGATSAANGGAGSNTTFGSLLTGYGGGAGTGGGVSVNGGGGGGILGAGGTPTAGTYGGGAGGTGGTAGSNATLPDCGGGGGGGNAVNGAAGFAGGSAVFGGGGGGSGSGSSSGAAAGGAGGATQSSTGGTAGASGGGSPGGAGGAPTSSLSGGGGGGGGGTNASTTGGNGGAGAIGGGGGGGGFGTATFGHGGAGGGGLCVVICW